MSLRDWAAESREAIQEDGTSGAAESARKFVVGAVGRAGRIRGGMNIFSREWDVCILLDSCRVDLMQQVAPEVDWLEDVDEIASVASCSHEWMDKTFVNEVAKPIAETHYVTANPYSGDHLDHSRLASIDELWQTDWDVERGTVLPEPVTDQAIAAWDRYQPSRLLVHYMQPHYPFLDADTAWGTWINGELVGEEDDASLDPWELLRKREVSLGELWRDYRSTLEVALEDVERLLAALPDDADVVVTSDHGNAVGEKGVYGHPVGVPLAPIRRVPWVRADPSRVRDETVVDYDEVDIFEEDGELQVELSAEEKLEALGYR